MKKISLKNKAEFYLIKEALMDYTETRINEMPDYFTILYLDFLEQLVKAYYDYSTDSLDPYCKVNDLNKISKWKNNFNLKEDKEKQ